MRYYSDCKLTDIQQGLKWYIYCVTELEDDNDIKHVLKSLLAIWIVITKHITFHKIEIGNI